MYLYTDRVYNHKIDDYINSTSIKQLGGKYNLWTFTWFVHFKLPFRLKGTEKIHTEKFSKFPLIYNLFSMHKSVSKLYENSYI